MNVIMRLLPGSSTRARLLGACCGLALLTALVGGVGTWRFATMNAAFHQAANENLPAVSHLVQADRDMERALVAQRTLMFITSDSPAAQEQMKSYTSSMLQITEHWKAYAVFPAHAGEAKLRAEFETARVEWEKSAGEVVKLLAQHSTDARQHAIDVSLNEGTEKFEKARKVLRSLSDMHLSAAASSVKTEEARAATIRWWMFVGIGAALVSAFAVSLVLARSISRPLAETVDLLRNIAEGEGDLTKRLTGASEQLLGATGQLASGTQEQAASLEETAASLEEASVDEFKYTGLANRRSRRKERSVKSGGG